MQNFVSVHIQRKSDTEQALEAEICYFEKNGFKVKYQ